MVGRVDVLNGFEAPFDIINKSGTKKKVSQEFEVSGATLHPKPEGVAEAPVEVSLDRQVTRRVTQKSNQPAPKKMSSRPKLKIETNNAAKSSDPPLLMQSF